MSRSHCHCLPGDPHLHTFMSDQQPTHVRRITHLLTLGYCSPDNPLRMLAACVLSLATEDARKGQHVTVGLEWLQAAEIEPSVAVGAGLVVLIPCDDCGQVVDPDDPGPWHRLSCPKRVQVAA